MAKITRNTNTATISGLCLILVLLVFSSCTQQAGTFIPDTKDSSALGRIEHFIPEETIKAFRADYNTERDSLARREQGLFLPESEAFNKPALLKLLKDPNCVGIRAYYGIKKGSKRNELRLILVGVDAQGKDILINKSSAIAADAGGSSQGGLEYGQCPPCQN